MSIVCLQNMGYSVNIDTFGAKITLFKEGNIVRIHNLNVQKNSSDIIFFARYLGNDNTEIRNLFENVDFEVIDKYEESVIISCDARKIKDLNMNFVLTIKYSLDASILNITYNVVNLGDETIEYRLGSNFNFMYRSDCDSEYILEFENEEDFSTKFADNILNMWKSDENTIKTIDIKQNYNKIVLDDNIFSFSNVYFEHINSQYFKIYNKIKNYGVKIQYNNFNSFGIYIDKIEKLMGLIRTDMYTDNGENNRYFTITKNNNLLHKISLSFY